MTMESEQTVVTYRIGPFTKLCISLTHTHQQTVDDIVARSAQRLQASFNNAISPAQKTEEHCSASLLLLVNCSQQSSQHQTGCCCCGCGGRRPLKVQLHDAMLEFSSLQRRSARLLPVLLD